jgi:hypothetical protein
MASKQQDAKTEKPDLPTKDKAAREPEGPVWHALKTAGGRIPPSRYHVSTHTFRTR